MAIYDLHRSHVTPVSTILATRVVNAVFAVIDAIPAARLRRPMRRAAMRRALLSLSDATLADVGLTRADIARL